MPLCRVRRVELVAFRIERHEMRMRDIVLDVPKVEADHPRIDGCAEHDETGHCELRTERLAREPSHAGDSMPFGEDAVKAFPIVEEQHRIRTDADLYTLQRAHRIASM